jgi:hypothetical protein
MATDGPEQQGSAQSRTWHHFAEVVQRFGPAASVAGYGVAVRSPWMVLAGAVLELVQEPIRRILIGVADEVGPALGLALKIHILGRLTTRIRGSPPLHPASGKATEDTGT